MQAVALKAVTGITVKWIQASDMNAKHSVLVHTPGNDQPVSWTTAEIEAFMSAWTAAL